MRTIKSYVLRAGRVSPRQQQGLDTWLKEVLLPAPPAPWHFNELFGANAPVVVEIGFGMGASLIQMAKDNPGTHFIGIEVHQAGIGGISSDIHDLALQNIRIAPFDAVAAFKESIADDSVDVIQIFFPDPWPKARHHKRRIIQPEFVALLAKKLKPGGMLHCATDWENYAEHMLSVLSAEPSLVNKSEDNGFAARPESRPLTKFEARGQRLGHGVWDLVFAKA